MDEIGSATLNLKLIYQAQRSKKTRESKKIHGGMNLSQQQRKDDEKLVVENSLRRRSVEKSLTPSYLDDEEDG